MIYLNKNNKAAQNYVTEFINKNWLAQNDGTSRYQNISYADIKNPVKLFRGFFVDEQNSKCCYCCKDIVNDNTTELEHLIPQAKSNIIEFQPYYEHSYLLQQNVVPQSVFTAATTQQDLPPFPHHIAYHNIVASCNGRTFKSSEELNFTCCNRERGDEFLPPFNLMQDSVGYIEDGTIVFFYDLENRGYFRTLNLDKDILKNIRRLWYLFSKSELTLQEILNSEMGLEAKITIHAIGNSNTLLDDVKLLETFSNEDLWDIFCKYSYFLDYYRTAQHIK